VAGQVDHSVGLHVNDENSCHGRADDWVIGSSFACYCQKSDSGGSAKGHKTFPHLLVRLRLELSRNRPAVPKPPKFRPACLPLFAEKDWSREGSWTVASHEHSTRASALGCRKWPCIA
jgi:hypothetical protein